MGWGDVVVLAVFFGFMLIINVIQDHEISEQRNTIENLKTYINQRDKEQWNGPEQH